MEMKRSKLSARLWAAIAMLGFIGQLAWAIENNYINLWVFSQTNSSDAITYMSVLSALCATITTFLMGTLSDKIGRRKLFISIGYIIWGCTVFAFGLISKSNMASLYGAEKALLMVGVWMTFMDCLMTFFGSTANDACFNAMITDQTDESNRGRVESILAPMPLFANVLMMAIGIPLNIGAVPNDAIEAQVASGQYASSEEALAHAWLLYYLICGALVFLIGVISIFLLPEETPLPKRDESYLRNLVHGFKPSVIKNNKELYLTLLVFLGFNSAINSFMPYYMVYMQIDTSYGGCGLGSGMDFYLSIGLIFIISSIVAILAGLFLIDRMDRFLLLAIAFGSTAIGCLGVALLRQMALLILSGTIMMSGYLIATSVLGAMVRDKTPAKEVGLFQGIRMIFTVLLPMTFGPLISQAFFPTTEWSSETEFSLKGKTPTNVMFFVALGFLVLTIIPLIFLIRVSHRAQNEPPHDERPLASDGE